MALTPWGKRHEAVQRAQEFLAECCDKFDLGTKTLTKPAKEWIGRRRWGDDPAEMQRLIYTAALISKGSEIDAVHFPPRLNEDHEALSRAHFDDISLEKAVEQKIAHFFKRIGRHEVTGLHRTVTRQVERPLIVQALEWAGGNQLKAARILGINRNTLRRKMSGLGIKK